MYSQVIFLQHGVVYSSLTPKGKSSSIGTNYPYFYFFKPLAQIKHEQSIKRSLSTIPTVISYVPQKQLENIITEHLNIYSTKASAYSQKAIFTSKLNFENLSSKLVEKTHHHHIIIHLDLNEIVLTIFKPKLIKEKIHFSVNTVGTHFKNLLDFFEQHKQLFPAFMSTILNNEQLMDILLNINHYLPLRTSSPIIRDLIRALVTAALIQIKNQYGGRTLLNGSLYITGPLVYTIDKPPFLILATAEGLGLKGLWEIFVDNNLSLLGSLIESEQLEEMTYIVLPHLKRYIYYTPFKETPQFIEIMSAQNDINKIIAPSDNIFYFKTPYRYFSSATVITNKGYSNFSLLEPAKPHKLTGIIIDTRKRPFKYGPSPVENTSLKIWLKRLNKPLKITTNGI